MAWRPGTTLTAACVVGVLALTTAYTARAADTAVTPVMEKLIKAAQAEGQLNVMWGASFGASEGARAFENAINKTYGTSIKINYTPGPSMPQMATRTIEEVRAGRVPTTDVYLGIEVSLVDMLNQDMLIPVRWSDYYPAITPEMMPADGRVLLVATLFNGILYNADIIHPADVPHKVADVFNPKWKGKIASTTSAVGFERMALAYGFDTIKPIVQKTAEWAGGLMRCGDNDRILTGEFIMLFLNCGSRIPDNQKAENGGPLGSAELDDALSTTLTYFAIPKNSAHPNLAILYSGFLTTKEGQEIMVKYADESSHLVPGTPAYAKARAFEKKGDKLLAYGPTDIMSREADLNNYKDTFVKMLLKQ
jgi:iron(III) transport system substrate-binding protein